ncbi:MAG TPA: NYN domain-containing protein [Armatimonadota bacterium]|jgi:hypothetical protein
MRYLIDGSNCLGRLPGFEISQPDSEGRFLETLRAYASSHRSHEFTVFFDGYGGVRTAGSALRIRRAGSGQSADDLIVSDLKRHARTGSALSMVVTDDRDLAQRCRRAGGRTSSTSSFWEAIQRSVARNGRKPAQPQPSRGSVEDGGLSPREVKEWEEFFAGPRQM